MKGFADHTLRLSAAVPAEAAWVRLASLGGEA